MNKTNSSENIRRSPLRPAKKFNGWDDGVSESLFDIAEAYLTYSGISTKSFAPSKVSPYTRTLDPDPDPEKEIESKEPEWVTGI